MDGLAEQLSSKKSKSTPSKVNKSTRGNRPGPSLPCTQKPHRHAASPDGQVGHFPLFNRSRTHCSRRALQMHVKGHYFPSRVQRLDTVTATQHDGALFSNITICIAGRLCITHGESAGCRPSRFPGFSAFFCLLVPAEARQTPSPRPERTDEMDTYTTSPAAIGADGGVGLRAAFSHAIPSVDDLRPSLWLSRGLQSFSADSL